MINTINDYDGINTHTEHTARVNNNKKPFDIVLFKTVLEKALTAKDQEAMNIPEVDSVKIAEDPAGKNKLDWAIFEEGFPKKRCKNCGTVVTEGDYCMDCAKQKAGGAYGIFKQRTGS